MKSVDKDRARRAMAEFLSALGLEGPELASTPARVTDAYADELLSGYGVDLAELIVQGSEPVLVPHDPILIDQLHVATVCPHHLLVAQGKALVAYIPGARILGLGAVARLVDACSRRLVFQEQIASHVADALMDHLGARGAFCRIQLNHACLGARGAQQTQAQVTTWAGRGDLKDPALLEMVLGRFLVEPDDVFAQAAGTDEEDNDVSRVHHFPPDQDPPPA